MWFFLLIWLPYLASSPGPPGDDGEVRTAILKAAHAAWRSAQATHIDQIEIRLTRFSGDIDPHRPLRVVFPTTPALPRGRSQVNLMTRKDDESWEKAGWALLHVAYFDSVAVSRRLLSQDEPVRPEDVQSIWMDVTTFRGTPLHPDTLRRRAAKGTAFLVKTVTADRALKLADIRPPYAVSTSESVMMTYRRNGVALELACKARGRGLVGDVIRVFSPTSKRTYRVRLTAPGRSEWLETLN